MLVAGPEEDAAGVVVRLLAYLLLYRDRLLVEPRLEDLDLPFRAGMVALDYEGRIALWVECGECPVTKLDRLAVKASGGEIWAVKGSPAEAEQLLEQMRRQGLRRERYGVLGLEAEMVAEMAGLLQARNELLWYRGDLEAGTLQFEFNGLWFDGAVFVGRH
jgi:uncharacterized protein YaeQ